MLRPPRSLFLALLLGCGVGCLGAGRRGTGTSPNARIGADPVSHLELTVTALTPEQARQLEAQLRHWYDLKNVKLSYADGTAVYSLDIVGCECALPEKIAGIPAPGLRYQGRTTQLRYAAFDNQPPTLHFVFPHRGSLLTRADALVVLQIPDDDVATVQINGRAAERYRGKLFRARVPVTTGSGELVAVATDRSGNVGKAQVHIEVDSSPVARLSQAHLMVTGTATPGAAVFCEGEELPVDAQGRYGARVAVRRGQATLELLTLEPDGTTTIALRAVEDFVEAGPAPERAP